MSYYENQFAEDFEENQIKGVSDLGVDLTKCANILTEDLKFTVYYDDNSLLVVNNHEKDLISKKIFTKKIQKVKVYPNNFISYLLNDDEGSTIITTHLDCIEDNLEMKRPFKIVDYLIFNFLAPLEFYLYLNSNGDIHVCRNAEIISRSTNIFRDVNIIDRKFAFKVEDVIKIFYSEETQNLIVFFAQGKMLNYFIDTSSFNANEINKKDFSNSSKKSILIFQDFLNLLSPQKDANFPNDNRGSLLNLGLASSRGESTCEIIKVQTIEQQSSPRNTKDFYLVVGFNHSNVANKLKVFFFMKIDLNAGGNFNLDSDIDISRVHRLMPLNDNIDYLNSFLLETDNKRKITDLSLFDLILFNTEFALSQRLSRKVPNSILFVMQSKKEGCFYIFTCSLDSYLSEVSAIKINYFSKFTVDGNSYSILNFSQMGVFTDEISDKDTDFTKLCVSIRATYARNKNQIYILDDVLLYDDVKEENKAPASSPNFSDVVAKDPFEYFEFYQAILKNRDNKKLNDFEELCKSKLIELFKKELLISHDIQFSSIDEHNANYKFDSYLAYLIFANNYLAIKNYLSILDPSKEDFPFVSNEKLFFTIKTLYDILTKEIEFQLNKIILNPEFFNNQKLLEIIRILSKLLYVNKSRAENSIFKPYALEREILIENSYAISKLIEKVESLLTIVKIYKNFSLGKIRIQDFSAFENHRFQYFYSFVALVFPSLERKVLPEIKLFYLNYIQNFLPLKPKDESGENENKTFHFQDELNIVLKNSIYASNFSLFLVFAYYLILSEVLKITENNKAANRSLIGGDENITIQIKHNLIKLLGQDLSNEIHSYFDLVFQIFLLDYKSNLSAQQIYSETNLKTNLLGEFTLFLNKNNFAFSPVTSQLSDFNSSFLNNLLSDERFQDALVISKNLIPYYKEYEELVCQLKIFLSSDLLLMGFQFINDCFALLIKLPPANYNQISRSENEKKKFFEELKQENNFLVLTMLYQEFFKFLISNNKIEFLFNLPLNIVERNILKDLILSEGKLEHLIILYYMKIKNLNAAEISFHDIKNSGNFNEESFNIYSKFIKAMKFIFAKKDARLPDDWVNDGVDSQLFSGSANKDYKMGINFRNNQILFKGKVLINKPSSVNLKAEDKMDIVDKDYEAPTLWRNQKLRFNNFEKINEPIDSISELDHYPLNPSNITLNDSLRNILEKKQETAKKTFDLFSEKKSKFNDVSRQEGLIHNERFLTAEKRRINFHDQSNTNYIGSINMNTPIKLDFESYKKKDEN